jgi:hypothetical protein
MGKRHCGSVALASGGRVPQLARSASTLTIVGHYRFRYARWTSVISRSSTELKASAALMVVRLHRREPLAKLLSA